MREVLEKMEKMEKVRRILVLDGSRVVRATLSKHLRDDFEVIEESSGESAWQTLMLDAGISAVISGIHPLKLDAHDLLARLRASSIRRLQNIPFILIVSDLDNKVERDADRASGVAGFITKTMNRSAMLAALNGLFIRTAKSGWRATENLRWSKPCRTRRQTRPPSPWRRIW